MFKVCNEIFIHLFTHVTLEYFNFKWWNELQDAKGSLSTYFCFLYHAMLQCSYLYTLCYAKYYAHEKTCASFCIKST